MFSDRLLGPGVESVKVGDRVLAPPGSFTWRERMVVSAGGPFPPAPGPGPPPFAGLAENPPAAGPVLSRVVGLRPGGGGVQKEPHFGVGARGVRSVDVPGRQ